MTEDGSDTKDDVRIDINDDGIGKKISTMFKGGENDVSKF